MAAALAARMMPLAMLADHMLFLFLVFIAVIISLCDSLLLPTTFRIDLLLAFLNGNVVSLALPWPLFLR